jgi:hypothetical protein
VLSRRVQTLCGILLLTEVVLVLVAAFQPLATPPAADTLSGLLGGVWISWVVTQVENYRLMRCGPLRERFRIAPLAINRSALIIRTTFHLAINWSAIATTLVVMLLLGPNKMDRALAYTCLAATVLIWLTFNLMHRRVNRLQNLLFTTSIAGGLFVLSAIILAR